MLSKKEIKGILVPILKQLEEKRQEIKGKSNQHQLVLIISFLVSLGALGGIVALVNTTPKIPSELKVALVVILIIVICVAIGSIVFNGNKVEKFRQHFEATVKVTCYQPVFEAWKAGTTYHPTQKLPKAFLEEAEILGSYNEYAGDDYCKGTLADGRSFQFSELELKKITRAIDGNKVIRPVFEGLFFVLENVNPFKGYSGRVIITSKEQPTRILKKENIRPQNDSILDANFEPAIKSFTHQRQLFEQRYTVISGSPMDLNVALSDHFVEQINGLTDLIQEPIKLIFEDGKLYAAFSSQADFWRVSIEQSWHNKQELDQQIDDFQLTFELMDRLIAATASPDVDASA